MKVNYCCGSRDDAAFSEKCPFVGRPIISLCFPSEKRGNRPVERVETSFNYRRTLKRKTNSPLVYRIDHAAYRNKH